MSLYQKSKSVLLNLLFLVIAAGVAVLCYYVSAQAAYEEGYNAVHIPRVYRNETTVNNRTYTFSVYERTFPSGLDYSDTFIKQCDLCDPDHLTRCYNQDHNKVMQYCPDYVASIILASFLGLTGIFILVVFWAHVKNQCTRNRGEPLLPR